MTPRRIQLVFAFDTNAEAELAKAHKRGERAFIQPPLGKHWANSAGCHMPRDGAIIFRDLVGKLGVLDVECDKCGRRGRYMLARLIARTRLRRTARGSRRRI